MIQFILDNSTVLTYIAMGLIFISFLGIFYQADNNNDPLPPAVTLVVSFIVFGLLVFFTSSRFPVSSGPWKQIYRNDMDATIELTYEGKDKKQTIIAGKSPVDLEMLQMVSNFHYFKTFFEQFEDKWRKLSQLQEPIYQEWKENSGDFLGWSYMMDDFEKHLKKPGSKGPDYPREHMLTLTDRYLLEEVLGGDQEK